jgi:trk system potassium uptake protein TrkA
MILVIGCGRLGGTLAARLAEAGHEVTVLDEDRRNLEANLPRGFRGAALEGGEINQATLIRAGIARASAVVAVARDESTNVMAADVARDIFHVQRIVVRLDTPQLVAMYREAGFDVVSPVIDGALSVARVLDRQEAP